MSAWIIWALSLACERQIGVAEYVDRLDTSCHARVSIGTATVAMILNGLGLAIDVSILAGL
jgi:hypothetical protein